LRHDEARPLEHADVVAALEAHHAASFAWALACSRYHRANAEDTLQQAYLRVLDGRARFAGRSSVRTWLFGVIWRCAQEQRRRAAVRNALSGRVLVELLSRAVTTAPDDQLADRRDASRVRRALQALSHRQREVLELVAYHDLTIEEAGAVLGVSAGSARTHYQRGKKTLGALLDTNRGAP
jgi:RNA polymerase sigma-70 factor, ECF subfamily